ncbi:ABC transporter permease [Oceanicaulis sp. AH-315-P02]|nr:ABC transporter permease [Oceanicaulis sp. AH-315-P02]
MKEHNFSLARLVAILRKEFIQMRRDRMTFAMMVLFPVLQLVIFGFAINTDPKHLPTALIDRDNSAISRSLIRSLEVSDYLDIRYLPKSEQEAERLMAAGKINFIIEIPENLAANIGANRTAQVLIIAEATDPSAASGALAFIKDIINTGIRRELSGALSFAASKPSLVQVVVHRRYNPAGITSYNIVPGLLGIILSMTMTLMTAVALTRETERGTMENLLAMPARPLEVMSGKILPYVLVGYVQTIVVMIAARSVFDIPMNGSILLFFIVTTLYIFVNLTIGFVFSTIARSQMQAMQMTFFLLLPQILLSGFMFPFRGMPGWAQVIGEALPATHYIRLMRGIMLKGAEASDLWADIWPLGLMVLLVSALALQRYRRTLD